MDEPPMAIDGGWDVVDYAKRISAMIAGEIEDHEASAQQTRLRKF